MKRNLLTIGLLAFSISLGAQTLTYVGEDAKLFVGTSAIVYSGGDFTLNSVTDKSVENKGVIIIDGGDYTKGTASNAASDGKEFVNVYTGANDYGQVIIRNTKNATNARMTMQRPAASDKYFYGTYPISFPYKDVATYLMKSFGKLDSDFVGAGQPVHNVTLRKWNNDKIQHDPVATSDNLKAGDYYLFNLRPREVQAWMAGIIGYKGMAEPKAYNATGKSVLPGMDEQSFGALTYGQWKYKWNEYGETYWTYLTPDAKPVTTYDNSRFYGKNVYHFGNPYTSNLDLSAFDGANAWLRILNNGGSRTIKQATDDLYIRNFSVSKPSSTFGIIWNGTSGSINTSGTGVMHIAKFDGTQWTGNAEALLIRPLEIFSLSFPGINTASNAIPNRIVNVQVDFNDNHKTFKYAPSVPGAATTGKMSTARVASTSAQSSFYQSELVLMKDDVVLATPAYLVGTTAATEESAKSTTFNSIFVYGIDANGVKQDSKKDFTFFNINDYVGKPLGIGFNNLEEGQTYTLGFNLTEGSIFNPTIALNGERFYLYDKETKKLTEITSESKYQFVADANSATRFEMYWRQGPIVDVLGTSSAVKSGKTMVYTENSTSKVRFASTSEFASVSVYDMSGKLVLTEDKVSTATDYVLSNLPLGTYLVKVAYTNGEVVTLKTLK